MFTWNVYLQCNTYNVICIHVKKYNSYHSCNPPKAFLPKLTSVSLFPLRIVAVQLQFVQLQNNTGLILVFVLPEILGLMVNGNYSKRNESFLNIYVVVNGNY